MSFFKPSSPKSKLKARAGESIKGGQWLTDFMDSWPDQTDYPQRQVADLSPIQQEAQALYQKYITGGNEGRNLAMGWAESKLGPDYNPAEDPDYKFFKDEATRLAGDRVTNARQRSQMGAGTLQHSPSMTAEGDIMDRRDSELLSYLDRISRGDKATAANMAGNIGQNDFSNVVNSAGFAGQERGIDEQRNAAMYDESMKELLHEYTRQAGIAMDMMQYSPGTYIKPGGKSDWDTGMGVVSDVMAVGSGMAAMRNSNSQANYYDAAASQY